MPTSNIITGICWRRKKEVLTNKHVFLLNINGCSYHPSQTLGHFHEFSRYFYILWKRSKPATLHFRMNFCEVVMLTACSHSPAHSMMLAVVWIVVKNLKIIISHHIPFICQIIHPLHWLWEWRIQRALLRSSGAKSKCVPKAKRLFAMLFSSKLLFNKPTDVSEESDFTPQTRNSLTCWNFLSSISTVSNCFVYFFACGCFTRPAATSE